MGIGHSDLTFRSIEGLTTHGSADFLDVIRTASLLYGLLPNINADVAGFHRVIGDAIIAILLLEGFDKLLIRRRINGHEVVPCRIMSLEEVHTNGFNFFFSNTDRHGRILVWSNASPLQLLEESHVTVTVEGVINHAAIRQSLLNLGDDRRNFRITQRQIVFTHHLTAQLFHLSFDDVVGSAGEHIVRTHQEELFTLVFKEPIHRRFNLLVWCCTGIENVLGTFLTFILHRIEEHMLFLFKYGQYCLPTG